ncbi:MAG TPA: SdrD B-like domain-containing protein [Opitutus sp.]|nr:SdrD B-like domain-containing protein [Opitutus sp.]
MKYSRPFSLSALRFFWKCVRLGGGPILLGLSSVVQAALPGTPVVVYSPNTTQNIQGDEPLHAAYVLSITSPNSTLLTNVLSAVSLNVDVISAPAGVDPAVARSYVTFSSASADFVAPQGLNFHGANYAIQVTIHVDVPVGATTGDFSYKLSTSGWPITVQDNGTFINMHADPPANLVPPVVTITSPEEGHVYTYVVGGPAVAVPVRTVGVATQSAPVLTLVANLDGVDENGATIPSASIPLTLTDLGTPSADGVATLSLTTAGSYTITSTATNSVGPANAVVHFVVVKQVPPPPVIVFTQSPNPTYTVLKGDTLNVPFAIRTSSTGINIATQTVTLNGQPVTLTSNTANGSALVATANGSLPMPTAAVGTTNYTLHAHGTDTLGQVADTETTFQVTVVAPTISVVINPEIAGNSPYMLPASGALTIPFTFTGDVTLGSMGATVDTLTGVLGGAIANTPVTITSSTGLGTAAHATGSGTLSITTAGTYTLTATDTNTRAGVSATTSVTFVVQPAYIPPPPPVIVFTQAPSPSYTVLQGDPLSVPFAIRTSSTGVNIYSQSVTLDGQAVTLTSNTANGTALVATGGATLAVATTNLGTTTYSLHAYGLDVLGQPCDTVTTFTVNVVAPVITIAINPEVAGHSPYTLPASGPLSIPFTFTGDITAGATVDTITGALGNAAVTITSYTGLGTSSHATGSGTLTITTPGTYSLSATDTNTRSHLSATTSVIFVVESAAAAATIEGNLFFDVNFDGHRDAGEYGMAGVAVKLLDASGHTVASTLSDGAGHYSFTPPAPGTYTVSAMAVSGFSFTTLADHTVTVAAANVVAPDTGYGLYFAAIRTMTSTALSQGFWKNNVSKNLSGKTNGTQVSLANIQAYTAVIASLALPPFDGMTMSAANTVFTGKNQLQLQLLAAEYNYVSGAYIGGNRDLTYAFIYWGETVLQNTGGRYNSAYQTFTASWMEAYDTSEGGLVNGPLQ